MADSESLTLSFVTSHPAEAARILERLQVSDAAALFAHLPARAGAPVLSAMLPSSAANVITSLDTKAAQALLANTGTQTAVAILRQIADPLQSQLVDGLPTAVAMTSRLLLYYPDDSVGAWIDPDIVVFPPETSVGEAIARIGSGKEAQVDLVFTVDREQRLTGIVSVFELLRVPAATMLSNITRTSQTVLSASVTIGGIARRRGWQQTAAIPVIDRNEHLIGVLRRGALERAMARGNRPAQSDDEQTLSGMLASGYWGTFSVLAQTALSVLPKPKPIVSDKT
ncbi:MAG: CBS domain-containing protein [Burkholderiales bacterium]|jgi:Mg/Co/Ni transporter MgtE